MTAVLTSILSGDFPRSRVLTAILLAILAGSLVFAGIALRLMMRPRRRA